MGTAALASPPFKVASLDCGGGIVQAEQDLEKLEEAEKKKAAAKVLEKQIAKDPMQELEEAVAA